MSPRFARNPKVQIATPVGHAFEAPVASRFASRLAGLAWLPRAAAQPLLIPRCRSVHTLGMRFAIDVAFVAVPADGDGAATVAQVLDLRAAVPRRRLVTCRARAPEATRIAALELPAGWAMELGIEAAARLEWRPVRGSL